MATSNRKPSEEKTSLPFIENLEEAIDTNPLSELDDGTYYRRILRRENAQIIRDFVFIRNLEKINIDETGWISDIPFHQMGFLGNAVLVETPRRLHFIPGGIVNPREILGRIWSKEVIRWTFLPLPKETKDNLGNLVFHWPRKCYKLRKAGSDKGHGYPETHPFFFIDRYRLCRMTKNEISQVKDVFQSLWKNESATTSSWGIRRLILQQLSAMNMKSSS